MKKEHKITAKDLGINISSKKEAEYFKWFLACLLFGKPIQQEVAKRTYFEFVKKNLITPQAIIEAGWNKLVKVLDGGHYVRYDYSTATKLLEVCKTLIKDYGSVTKLIESSINVQDLKKKLLAFKGIGPVTSKIFLREIKLS